MTDPHELANALCRFYGTEQYYFNPLYRWLEYTDGVKFFVENAGNGAFWFLDTIGTELRDLARKEEFLSIRLEVVANSADIFVGDGNGKVLYSKCIRDTDCPPGYWDFFLTNGILMMPSEY